MKRLVGQLHYSREAEKCAPLDDNWSGEIKADYKKRGCK
jgi:hypothetical protein